MANDDFMVPAREYNAEAFVPNDLLDQWVRPLIAEFIGPFALVFLGAGSILIGADLVVVGLAHGLAIGLMVAAAGHISGGHYNPAVTIALFLGGKVGLIKSAAYIIAQLLGAVVAALFLDYIFDKSLVEFVSSVPAVNYGGDADVDGFIIGRGRTFVIEIILTFFLVYVIHGVAVDSRGAHAIAPLAIGLTITADIFMGGPLTGAAMNPARHFGPALVASEWKDTWIYWAGPIIGGALASIVHNYIFIPRNVGFPEPMPGEHHV
jgi:aquaporin Z